MKMTVIVVVVAMVLAGGMAIAQESLVDSVARGCEQEIKMFCKDVTPGEGRVLACLYSFWDRLSDQCDNALYDAAAQLQRAIAVLSYLENECRDDLKTYCSNIQPGEGRVLQCLDRNDANLTKRCRQALKDRGLKK
jgi:Cysteine rich repeat